MGRGERGDGRGERGKEEMKGKGRGWKGELMRAGDRMSVEFEACLRMRSERRGDGRNPGRKSWGSDGRERERMKQNERGKRECAQPRRKR